LRSSGRGWHPSPREDGKLASGYEFDPVPCSKVTGGSGVAGRGDDHDSLDGMDDPSSDGEQPHHPAVDQDPRSVPRALDDGTPTAGITANEIGTLIARASDGPEVPSPSVEELGDGHLEFGQPQVLKFCQDR